MEINIKDLNVNYEIIGEGKPVLIIHGYYPDHRLMTGCMEPVFNESKGYKRIYIDLPGMGRTKGEKWITNSDIMLDIVIEFIEKVIPKENFLLAGESYGGYLSRGIIYKMADRIEGLMLLCPCIVADSKKRNVPEHVVLRRDEALLLRLHKAYAEDFNSMAVVQSDRIWQRYRDEILCGVKIADDKFLSRLKGNGYEFSFDVDKMNKKYDRPHLCYWGARIPV